MPRSTEPRRGTAIVVGLAAFALALALDGIAPVSAQVVFDDSLTTPGEAPLDPGGTTWQIESDRGAKVGGGGHANLFYSFERFDVPAAHTAEFRPDADVAAIVSRVTGGALSRIDGHVRVSAIGGGAGPDLFLVNPAGVLFGGSTRVDTNGAFRVSTASGVGFADGGFFSARDVTASLPTSDAEPALLRFDGGPTGDVRVEGRLFSNDVGTANDASVVSLVGANVTTLGPGSVAPEQATLELGAVGGRVVDVPLDLRDADLGPGSAPGGLVRIDAGAGAAFNLSTLSPNPDQGRIVIRGGELVLVNGGLIAGGSGAAGEEGRAIDVAVAGRIALSGSSAKLESQSGATFGPGDVRIRAERLELADAASIEMTSNRGSGAPGRLDLEVGSLSLEGVDTQLKSTTRVAGAGADLEVRARTIRLADGAAVFSEGLASGAIDVGAVGDVDVVAQSLELVDGGRILSVTNDAGAAGRVSIDATTVALSNAGRILTETRGTGAGGDVVVRADSLSLAGQSSVTTASTTDSTSGDLRLDVGALRLSASSAIGTGSIAPVVLGSPPTTGPGGDVVIVAESATIESGSQLSTSTDGAGDAGDLELDVRDRLFVTGRLGPDQPSGLFARSGSALGSAASGNGGRIVVRAGSLRIEQGAQISSTTVGTGRAGEIDVETVGALELDRGRISAIASDVGATGDVRLVAGRMLRVRGGSEIVSEAPIPLPGPSAPGAPPAAGGLTLEAGERIVVEDARIATDSARPESGDVRLTAVRGITLARSSVTTNVDSPSGRGGDVLLDTQALVLGASTVTANADGQNADAGNVTLRAGAGLLQSSDSRVEARAALGLSGDVVRATPDTNLPEELARLAATPATGGPVFVEGCAARQAAVGSFTRSAAPIAVDSPEAPLDEGPATDPEGERVPPSAPARAACPGR